MVANQTQARLLLTPARAFAQLSFPGELHRLEAVRGSVIREMISHSVAGLNILDTPDRTGDASELAVARELWSVVANQTQARLPLTPACAFAQGAGAIPAGEFIAAR